MRLRRVQQRHLRAILRVPYTDRITNDQILDRAGDRAGVPDIEMIVRKMQLRWAGHVARMSDNRIPKQLLFGELTIGTRTVGRPLLRWKDSLKDTLKQSNISTTHWQDTATDRRAWRRSIHDGLVLYDDSRRERGMPPSELVVMQLVMRHHQHHRTPTCVDTAEEHAVVASAS